MGLKIRSSDGSRIELGNLITGLIMAAILAGSGAVLTGALTSQKATANTGRIEKVEDRQRTIETNQAALDANQGHLLRDSRWTLDMLNALLRSRGIEAPAQPPLPAATVQPPAPE